MNTQEAIQDIVDFRTLPPQIDYTRPFAIKAQKAQNFLETLSESEKQKAEKEIDTRVDRYYESGAAYWDSLF